MSPAVESGVINGDFSAVVNHLFDFPDTFDNCGFRSRANPAVENRRERGIPVDILENPKEFIFYMDVPGLSKSDIQVTIEDENTLVVKSSGKRKHDDDGEEQCKYIRLERRLSCKLLRKFRLPENANASAVSAKCEHGVLTVAVEKNPPPKPKTVQVAIA